MIEALDGRDDEGPSHPSVICRISHCFTVRDPLLYCCCWRLSLQEFLLTADNIPSRGIQCTKISFSQKTRKESKGEKNPTTLAWFLRARRVGNETAPLGSYELHPQRYVSVIALNPGSTAQFSGRISEDFLHSLTLLSSGLPT